MVNTPQTKLNFPRSFSARDAEFLDETVHAITKWNEQFCKLFLDSESGQKLLDEIKESDVAMAISCFSEMCYGYHLQKPGQWTTDAVQDVCVNVMPRKILCDDDFFRHAATTIVTFIAWMQDNACIKNGTDLMNALKKHKYQMLENAQTPSMWGIGKSLLKGSETNTLDYDKNNQLIKEKLSSIEYYHDFFPEDVLMEARHHPKEAIPVFRAFISEAIENVETLDDDYMGHFYALFLLAEFKDTASFPLIMNIASLPEEQLDLLLGDIQTEDLHSMIASTYNGSISSIQTLIEDPKHCIWARDAGLRSLLVLVNKGKIEKQWVIDYFSYLINTEELASNPLFMAFIVHLSCHLYADELFPKIRIAFDENKVDLEYTNWSEVEDVIALGEDEALKQGLKNSHYAFIEKSIEKIKHWACFTECTDEHDVEDFSKRPSCDVIPFRRENSKIGRNDSCPCGSGKKYKKCCLM